jgi:hypothetical protein
LGFRLVHDSARRVLLGGSWNDGASGARVADRNNVDPTYAYGIIGFRLCVDWGK